MRKTINGTDGFGNKRTYDFRIISALEGLTLMHTYGCLLAGVVPQITALFEAWTDSTTSEKGRLLNIAKDDFLIGGGPVVELIKAVPHVIGPTRVVELARVLLAGAKIEDQECDDDGMCDLFRGRPHEVYAAIVNAIIANFPDYLPFLGTPDDTTGMKSDESKTK